MTINKELLLTTKLKQLVIKIQNTIYACQVSSSIEKYESIYYYDKIIDFQNIDDNPTWKSQANYVNQVNYNLSQQAINDLKNSDEYQSLIEYEIDNCTKIDDLSLNDFIRYTTDQLLNNQTFHEEKINEAINIFLNDINQAPFKCGVNIKLIGVLINSHTPLEFSINDCKIILRQIQVEDLEEKCIIYPYLQYSYLYRKNFGIDGIATIESYLSQSWKIQNEVEKLIAIFRLFRVSRATYISYNLYSNDAIVQRRKIGGTISKIDDPDINSVPKIKMTEGNIESFINFYTKIADYIPVNLYRQGDGQAGMIHLLIAYQHYCQALLSRTRIEEKITNAVIGLESLILAENQEIAFRFCVRGAKILSLLNYSPIEVKKNLKVAYNIRSTFVHGDDIELEKEVRKLDSNYQSQDFLLKILDYLRILIISTICLSKNSEFISDKKGIINFEKRKFLELVDDSLIDKIQESKLQGILEDVKLIISY